MFENIIENFENYFENFPKKCLKILRIIAENFDIKFWKISRNTWDIFYKYFSKNFEPPKKFQEVF